MAEVATKQSVFSTKEDDIRAVTRTPEEGREVRRLLEMTIKETSSARTAVTS